MNKYLRILITGFLLLFALVGPARLPAAAQDETPLPTVPDRPVHVPVGVETPRSSAYLALPVQLAETWSQLKAVVFVGPIDGNSGEWTLSEIESAQQTAAALRSYGVAVSEFYPNQDNGTWANIKAAAEGAHFLIYRGHGVSWGGSPEVVGGFYLKDGVFVSNDMIRNELHPARNFLVMLYGCFTAGSSGGDTASISLSEAQRRVAMYSDPFFDIGAGGYYADWFGDAFTSYVTTLLAGGTQRQAYEGFYDYNPSLMWWGTHPNHPELDLWLGWDLWYDPLPNYNNAFAGDPEQTLDGLFNTSMLLTTNQVTYLAEADFPAREYQITISSTSPASFNWSAALSATPGWLEMTGPLTGSAGEALRFSIDPTRAAGTQTLTATIEADSELISDSPQTLTITVMVVPEVSFVFLPVIIQ